MAKTGRRRILDLHTGFGNTAGVVATPQESDIITAIDHLLRFYVVLLGIRKAKQVPDESLRLCYAYWLNHYRKPDVPKQSTGRDELFRYVNKFYPNLKVWLEEDIRQPKDKHFFRTWP